MPSHRHVSSDQDRRSGQILPADPCIMVDFWSPAGRRPCTRPDHEGTGWSVHVAAHNLGRTNTLCPGLARPCAEPITSNLPCTMTADARFEGSRSRLSAIRTDAARARGRPCNHGIRSRNSIHRGSLRSTIYRVSFRRWY